MKNKAPEVTNSDIENHIGNTPQIKKNKRPQPEEISPFVDKLARLILAFGAGASLIVPVVIMRLNTNVTKSLITTSVAVVLFAVFLAFAVRASNTDTLAATATYAAVLVVFVGTSGH